MGWNYEIKAMRNGYCEYPTSRVTNNIFKAVWHLIYISIKYPIVDIRIRRGHLECEGCKADYCERGRG